MKIDTLRVPLDFEEVRDRFRQVDDVISGLMQPAILDWVPDYGGEASMTFTGVVTAFARYLQIGKLVYIWLSASGTTGGVASTSLNVTLPVNNAHQSHLTAALINVTQKAGVAVLSAGKAHIYQYDQSNYGLGAGRAIYISGVYEAE